MKTCAMYIYTNSCLWNTPTGEDQITCRTQRRRDGWTVATAVDTQWEKVHGKQVCSSWHTFAEVGLSLGLQVATCRNFWRWGSWWQQIRHTLPSISNSVVQGCSGLTLLWDNGFFSSKSNRLKNTFRHCYQQNC